MNKLLVYTHGGDWADAGFELLIVREGVTEEQVRAWRKEWRDAAYNGNNLPRELKYDWERWCVWRGYAELPTNLLCVDDT